MLDSQDERSGLHAVRQNHLVFLPSGRAGVSTRQKIGMKEGREVLGWFEVHPRLGISLREKMGAYSRRCPPPLTEPGAGQSISNLIRLIWSTQGPAPLTLARSAMLQLLLLQIGLI